MMAFVQGPRNLCRDCHPLAITFPGLLRSRGRGVKGTIGLYLVASEVYPELTRHSGLEKQKGRSRFGCQCEQACF